MDNVSAVKEKTDIVEFISAYVPLKKSGKNYKGRCPFHSEKTPSFMVSPEFQRYRCFGCGKSGDVLDFVKEIEGVDFAESLKILADKAGIELQFDKDAIKKQNQNQKLFEINEFSANFYHQILTKHKYGKPTLEYLKKRGIAAKTIRDFKFGYAPKSWESLSKALIK